MLLPYAHCRLRHDYWRGECALFDGLSIILVCDTLSDLEEMLLPGGSDLEAEMTDDRTEWLFSYGTLRQSEVQMALFGRVLEEKPDSLTGFRIDTIPIAEPDIVNLSGKATHLILRRSGESTDPIHGAALAVSETDLAIADDYEGGNYQRILVTLGSGRAGFVYVAPGE